MLLKGKGNIVKQKLFSGLTVLFVLLKHVGMGNYSIKDLERLSGVKAHTIRIWEQRYNIINPQRTDTNIRYYSDNDLRKLLNISLLNNFGYKISRIAQLTETEIHNEVKKVTEADQDADSQLAALTLTMIELDEERFEKLLASSILRIGFEATMSTIIFPFLERVGIMWMTGAINPAQEHFVTNMIRQKLIVAIDGQVNAANESENTFMLFSPEGEYHEIGLLFTNYLLRSRRKKTIYLGTSVPFFDLVDIYNVHHPKYIVCFITTTPNGEDLQQYIHDLSGNFPDSIVWFAGNQLQRDKFEFPPNAVLITGLQHAIEKINLISTATSSKN